MALKCCICGDKIGLMDTFGSLASDYPNEKVCGRCLDKKRDLFSTNNSDFNKALQYFNIYRSTEESKIEIFNIVDSWVKKGEFNIKQAECKQTQMDEEHKKLEDFMVTSGYNFEGYKIMQYCDYISAETVLGMGMFKSLFASVSSITGTESEAFNSKIDEAKSKVLYEIKKKAVDMGANAIIGIDIDFSMIVDSLVVIIASGTAVIIKDNQLI